jgi:hypothetical protein
MRHIRTFINPTCNCSFIVYTSLVVFLLPSLFVENISADVRVVPLSATSLAFCWCWHWMTWHNLTYTNITYPNITYPNLT